MKRGSYESFQLFETKRCHYHREQFTPKFMDEMEYYQMLINFFKIMVMTLSEN